MSRIREILGDNIRRFRNSKGWTQISLAEKLDITASFLTMIEAGQRGVSLDLLEKIAAVFDVPVVVLFIDNLTKDSDLDNLKYLNNEKLSVLQQRLISQISEIIENSIDELKV